MQCPVDGEALVIKERSGVEIDYCPRCRGVWLDRGELDKIISRSDQGFSEHTGTRDTHGRPPQKKKRESFFSELFDF